MLSEHVWGPRRNRNDTARVAADEPGWPRARKWVRFLAVDRLLRGLDGSKTIRVVAAVTTDLVRDAAQRHALQGATAVLLGRGLTLGCLLATLTKGVEERVRIAVRGDGPLGRVLVDARGDGRVRGCFGSERAAKLRLPATGPRAVLGPLVGSGEVVVTRDVGLDNAYQGVVQLDSGELDEDLERYLANSEQLPSVLRCQVTVDEHGAVVRAAGILAQTFPGSPPEQLDVVRNALRGNGLAEVLRHDREPEALIGFALAGGEYHLTTDVELRFSCMCGRDRARSIVSTLGADDIDALANEQGGTEVRCSFCGDAYSLSKQELHELAAQMRAQVN